MKNILKYLTIAGVLILFLPFFRMCTGKKAADVPVETVDSILQTDSSNVSTSILKNNTDSIEKEKANIQKEIDKEDTYSGFGLGIYFFKMTFVKEQNTTSNSIYDPNKKYDVEEEREKIKTVKDFFVFVYQTIITYIPFLFFVFIILNSFLLVFYSFKNKFKKIRNVAIINVSILIISYLLMYLGFYLVKFNQIKYGSYLFVINSILIIYFSIKNKKNITI
ncbi:membrane hypothetical protein [uncultured Paludibacter sp.]|nr:membrane hypothetical protein [uncultured Paludibacter sp.]